MTPTRALAAAAFASIVLAASACGGSSEEGYTPEIEENFTRECIDAATAEGSAVTDEQAKSYCDCAYDEVRATVPFEEFAEYDEKATEDPDTPLPPGMAAAAEKCIEEIEPS